MVQAQIMGFFPSDFAGAMPTIDVRNPPDGPRLQFPPVDIREARALQSIASSEAEFFSDNGFVLLQHRTAVTDWDEVPALFAEEIEGLIRTRLLPGTRVEIQQRPSPMRRGRGTDNPQYGQGVHSDGPLTAELYAANVGAFAGPDTEKWWTDRYSQEDVAGFMSIDFWRTTNMQAPLRHMPLALCAPNSLEEPDIVPMQFLGIAPDEHQTNHLALRYNAGQQWFFYPEMTGDEVLAFKLCEFSKDDPSARPQNCFHSAFVHPDTPVDAEERQSCEHRVGVLILRD
jgi:hypothetical protein